MSESYPFFTYEDDEWVTRYGGLIDEINSPDIELSATVIFYDQSRPSQLIHFLENKFGLKGPFKFLGNQTSNSQLTKSDKLKAISEDFKNKSNISETNGKIRDEYHNLKREGRRTENNIWYCLSCN
jgi:hypothetical protein